MILFSFLSCLAFISIFLHSFYPFTTLFLFDFDLVKNSNTQCYEASWHVYSFGLHTFLLLHYTFMTYPMLAFYFLFMTFFPSLGTLKEFSLEDFFYSFSFILLSSISSTSLLIPHVLHIARHWDYTMWSCLGFCSLFLSRGIVYPCIYLLILKNNKKIIYFKNPKKWYIVKNPKNWKMS